MKRKNYLLGVILLLVITILGGCSTKQQEVQKEKSDAVATEKAIVRMAKKVAKTFEADNSINFNVKKKTDRFLMYPDGHESEPFTMLIPCNFYERNEFEIPKMFSKRELPASQKKLFKKAQKIVLKYIDASNAIKKSDKKLCKETVENVTFYYGTFSEKQYADVAVVTVGSEMYINSKLENYISEYTYLHELPHVVSNITNKGSKYEFSAYRASKLNEAITDIIAVQLAKENGLSGYEVSAYQTYYESAYYMLSKFDMLETYYYSDGYDNIISAIGQNKFDSYILLTDNLSDEKCGTAMYYMVNEILKK